MKMPAPTMPAPPRPTGPKITLWQSEDGTQWLARLSYNGTHPACIRPTREEARAAAVDFWKTHTAEGKAET